MPNVVLGVIVAFQGLAQGGMTTPPGGDTVGYWQQRVHYQIAATLDEQDQRVRARGSLWYVNNSPDTLRALYFHQYLNAFRPGSKWSKVDEREGRERFQRLREPAYAYERFTAPVRVNGAPATLEYPGSPDSTLFRVALRAPLLPRDSLRVEFDWEARPSMLPRRQGRRGRHWDLAQWYPKVAVYDRGGWEPNALQPAGEFYGEFGTYDVTLIVANDQVLAATGVPVSGDPGWSRVSRSGPPRLAAGAYGDFPPPTANVPQGFRAVRFYAQNVHHFAWSAAPDYRYEGGVFARPVPATHFRTWDTVGVHVLYTPADDSTWGGQRALRRTIAALQWFEAIIGPYPYPQLTAQHRIDGGGSETPMLMMNGSPSQGLILHEGGHMYFYGALANNEWRSGWMDEGLTSYQTAWAQLLTPQERERAGITDRFTRPKGYRGLGIRMALPRFEVLGFNQATLDLNGLAQPLGTPAHQFRDFDTYNDITYDRAEVMFSQLRDVLGDTVFVAFLHEYYDRWALKHVDRAAMQASAERASGRDLAWFFRQWVDHTGVTDYRLARSRSWRDETGAWVTVAAARQQGDYLHPIPIGVRTRTGWTIGRMANFPYHRDSVRIVTAEQPLEVRVDPFHVTWDWDRRKSRFTGFRQGIDWPFLLQADRDRSLSLWRPMAWYSRPGEANVGLRNRSSYLGFVDRLELGLVAATADGLQSAQRVQPWLRFENPYLPAMTRPAMGWRGGVALLDDVLKSDIGYRMDNPANGFLIDGSINHSITQGQELLPEAWVGNPSAWSVDVDAGARRRWGRADATHVFADARIVIGLCDGCRYEKNELSAGAVKAFGDRARVAVRLFAGNTSEWLGEEDTTPRYRALYVSAEDPLATFRRNWWRPREAILKQLDVNWLPLGGPALRGYHWGVIAESMVAGNVDLALRAGTVSAGFGEIDVWVSLFGDAGHESVKPLIDAGPGLRFKGLFYDQPINLRLDFPVFVNQPSLALDRHGRGDQFAPRWVVTFTDLW
ncbi:MAG: M1 family metallopeptidase [Gemmatimonadaceae bacterium]